MDNFMQFSSVVVYPLLVRPNVNSLMALSNDYGRRVPSSSRTIAHSSLGPGKSSPCSNWYPDLASFSLQNHQTCQSPVRSYALRRFQCVPHFKCPVLNYASGYLQNDFPFCRFHRVEYLLEKPALRQVFDNLKRKEIHAVIAASRRFLTLSDSKAKTVSVKSAYMSPPPADQSIALNMDRESNGLTSGLLADEERKPKPMITGQLIGRLLWNEKGHLIVATVALLGATSCTLTMPIFSGRFFETLIGARPEPLWELLAKLTAIYALEPVFTVIFITNMITSWERIMARLRSTLFRRLILQKVEFFDKHKVGELTTLLSTDLGSLKDIIHENVSRDRGFRAISETIGTLLILYFVSPQLAPILGVLMLCVSTFAAIYKRKSFPAFMAYGQAQGCISDCANETFAAIRTVRSFGGERRQISAFDKLVFAIQGSGDKLGWLKSLNESCTRVVIYISLMALYILGGMKVKAGKLAVGNMVSFIGYTFVLTFSVQGVVNTLADVRATLAAVDRINSIVKESDVDESLARGIEQEVKDDSFHLTDLSSVVGKQISGAVSGLNKSFQTYLTNVCELAWSGDVAFEEVHFSYPSRPDVEVLKGTSLALTQGTITAMVGSSGAGKSTIVQLLARFYEPSKGRLTLAGEDVRQFSKVEWARAISIVNQEPILFALSIAENIAYGRPNEEVSFHEVVTAAKAANAHDFVVALPQGYETLVGERGSLLSGGQRQRIAIARALLKNSPILILDEATSALDSISERLVQDALDRLMKGRTTLVIAHRLSTVQRADKIAVCADGKIIEVGTHSQLLAENGAYSALVKTQRVTFE